MQRILSCKKVNRNGWILIINVLLMATCEKSAFQSIYSILPHHVCFNNNLIWQ